MAETSTKPYLIRAIHEWCTDNGYTPYVSVHVDSRTLVPREHVSNGEIVLNVSPIATSRLKLGNELIEFQARFHGTPRELSIPVENVSAIYARENGHGMAFEVTPPALAEVVDAGSAADAPPSEPVPGADAEPPAPGLGEERPAASAGRPPMLVSVSNESPETHVEGAEADAGGDPETDPEPPAPKPRQSRPKLTRIK